MSVSECATVKALTIATVPRRACRGVAATATAAPVCRRSRPEPGGQQQRHQERQVVVAGQDVRDAEAQIEEGASPERLGDAHVDRDLVRQVVEHDRRRRRIVAGGRLPQQEPRVAGVVGVVVEEQVVAKVQRPRVGPAGEALDEDRGRLGRVPLRSARSSRRRASLGPGAQRRVSPPAPVAATRSPPRRISSPRGRRSPSIRARSSVRMRSRQVRSAPSVPGAG